MPSAREGPSLNRPPSQSYPRRRAPEVPLSPQATGAVGNSCSALTGRVASIPFLRLLVRYEPVRGGQSGLNGMEAAKDRTEWRERNGGMGRAPPLCRGGADGSAVTVRDRGKVEDARLLRCRSTGQPEITTKGKRRRPRWSSNRRGRSWRTAEGGAMRTKRCP
jgi:hypothetical protein